MCVSRDMNAKETQAQTIKDEELELTKDYYAHHLTRSYYSPTGFANEFLSRNPNFKDKITDIYAFFNPEDAYRDNYNQICAKINALILWRNDLEENANKLFTKTKYIFVPHEKVISLLGDQPIIRYKQSYNRNFYKPSEYSKIFTRKDAPLHYIAIKLEWKKFTANGKTIMYYESEAYTLNYKKIEKMVRDHEIVVDKENNTTEICAGFNCEIVDFEDDFII